MTSSLFPLTFFSLYKSLVFPWIVFLDAWQPGFFFFFSNGVITCFYSLLFRFSWWESPGHFPSGSLSLGPLNMKLHPHKFSHAYWFSSILKAPWQFSRVQGIFICPPSPHSRPLPGSPKLIWVLVYSADCVGSTGENTPVALRFSFASWCRKLSITGPQTSLEDCPIPHTAVQPQ